MLENISKILVIIFIIALSLILFDVFFTKHIVIKYDFNTLLSSLSALGAIGGAIGSCATAFLAFKAYIIAKDWRDEKIKNIVFTGANDHLVFTNSIIGTVTFITKNLDARINHLNHFYGHNSLLTQQDKLIEESRDFSRTTQELRYTCYQSIYKSLRYSSVTDEKYKQYVEDLHLSFAAFLGNLETPIVIEAGSFKLCSKLIKYKLKILKPENEEFSNAISKLKADELINLDDAIRNLMSNK